MKRDLEGRMAVVTGASSGIGLCFCRALAGRGCDLVMVSNQDTLESCADSVSQEYNVKAWAYFCDLTDADCADKLIAYLDERELDPDYLINNAGIFSFKAVTATEQRMLDCFVSLHVSAVTNLSRAFALRFAARGGGRILNMSSMSCWMPMPGIALYSATKAYIRVFSRALYYEMRDSGVTVTVACPGGISTNLFGLPENLKRLALHIGALTTPEKFAKNAVNRMLKGRKQYINGFINRVSIVLVAMTPTPVRMLVKRLMLDKNITR